MTKIITPRSHRRDGKRVHAEAEYDVGYCKAPVSGRFIKGRSGNPSGRKKERKTFEEVVRAACHKPTRVVSEGKPVTMTMLEVMALQLVTKAAKGDQVALRNLMVLIRICPQTIKAPPARKEITPDMSPEEAMKLYQAYCNEGKDDER